MKLSGKFKLVEFDKQYVVTIVSGKYRYFTASKVFDTKQQALDKFQRYIGAK